MIFSHLHRKLCGTVAPNNVETVSEQKDLKNSYSERLAVCSALRHVGEAWLKADCPSCILFPLLFSSKGAAGVTAPPRADGIRKHWLKDT
ncbi:hypothetical protein HK13_06870 [Acetobacter indonesiensis]|uniref:Uncharacterized protein n=1 Tax=Acetobacter indonesiensis TaxID=104101 RepID=A0A252AY10_9PROT|nr:hypothetical protein HK13_06870 [Acetobacter indonesiensis]OUI96339.1 hypothetical protein HK17_12015 [Acetobacter indonesiensis]